jgi:hypothetical protein
VAAGAVVTASLLSACSPSTPIEGERAPSVTSTPAAAAPTAAVEVPVVRATPPPPSEPVVAPAELRIPAIDAILPVRPTGVRNDGSMEIPEHPAEAGWYRYGPAPGAPEGSAVIAAHVDDRVFGIGPLARLRDLEPGAEVRVEDETGATTVFLVESVDYIPRESLPIDRFFAREGEPALVIITCGGSFDEATRSYSDNVVAIARPAPVE